MSSQAFITTILAMHEAARTASLQAFQGHALDVVGDLLPFDSAVWGLGAGPEGQGSFINSTYLHHIDPAMMVEYEHVRGCDFIGPTVTADLGRTHVFHPRDACWSGPEYAAAIRHTQKWGMENILCTAIMEPRSGHMSFVSLYRRNEGHRFNESERRLKEAVMPHLSAAFLANRAWHLARVDGVTFRSPGAAALVDKAGGMHDTADTFGDLLRLEWPHWKGNTLPFPLLTLLRPADYPRFEGGQIVCEATSIGDLFLLTARRRTAVDELTPRERSISEYYSRGLTNKEIARLAGISPTTVRSHLATIYRKLGVSHKQGLAALLAQA